ncbi:MAG: hypothetical protein FWF79_00860 [Defluviitaleaceae bacterium]|nr:hypothetical protein [Defluviitaleaceae bacterium]
MAQIGQTERVILIKGDATKWYNQAIFIVNKDTPAMKMPVDFVAEAERIITAHMSREKAKINAVAAQGESTLRSRRKSNTMSAPTVTNYNTSVQRSAGAKPSGKFDFVLNFMMILACIAIVAVFVYGMMA